MVSFSKTFDCFQTKWIDFSEVNLENVDTRIPELEVVTVYIALALPSTIPQHSFEGGPIRASDEYIIARVTESPRATFDCVTCAGCY